MLHEVLLALLGHPGSIIQEEPASPASEDARAFNPATFRVPDSISFLTPTERAAINRVVNLGSTYRSLRNFVRPQAVPWTGTAKKDGGSRSRGGDDAELYVRALKRGVEEVLDEYAERVAEIESDVMADPTLPLARVYAGIREVRDITPGVLVFMIVLPVDPSVLRLAILKICGCCYLGTQHDSPCTTNYEYCTLDY